MTTGWLLKHLSPGLNEMVWLWRSGVPHEEDFYLFTRFNGIQGLFVDIGANWGQSAISLFTVNRSLKILSLEPNTELRWLLMLIFLRHPTRYRFRMTGAGDRMQRLLLHIPHARNIDLSTNASFEPREFEKDYVKERLQEYAIADNRQYAFRTSWARIIPLDSLGLKPLIVKLDVEGWELKALRGMEKTLLRQHPLLMIELNNRHQVFPWLIERGYRFFRYRRNPDSLVPIGEDEPCLNAFCLHPESPAPIHEQLAPLLPAGKFLAQP